MVSAFFGIAPGIWPKSRGPPPQAVCVLWLWNRITQKNNQKKTSIFVGLPVELSLLACPWKYFCCGLTVEVSSLWLVPVEVYLLWPARGSVFVGLCVEVSALARPRKYRWWPARGSISVGLPAEVSLLVCPWKYLCWFARGSIVGMGCP